MSFSKNDAYNEWFAQREATYSKLLDGKSASSVIEYQHKLYLTGTMSGVILGHSPYLTASELYHQFYEPVEDTIARIKENQSSVPLFLGRELETSVANYVNANLMPLNNGQMLIDFERPWTSAQVDRTYNRVPFEIKTVNFNRKMADGEREWGKGCLFNGYDTIVSYDDRVPQHYYDQVQKQISLMGAKYAFIGAYFKGGDIRVYKIMRDDERIRMINEAEDRFMFEHLIPQVPPVDIETLEGDYEDEEVALADRDFEDIICRLKQIRKAKNALDKEDKELTKKAKEAVGERSIVLDRQGAPIARLSTYKRTGFDKTKFMKEHYDLYKEYETETRITTLGLVDED